VTAPTRPLYSTMFGFVFRRAVGVLTPITPSQSFRGSERYVTPMCQGVIAMFDLCLVNPFGMN